MTPAPSPDPESPYTPRWMPSQFKGARAKLRRGPAIEDYSLGETIANAVSTGVGAVLAVAALVILVVMSVMHGGGVRLLAALAFGVPMLLAFLMNTLFHALPGETPKRVFKVLGHDFVFLYIAGAFTPYCVISLEGSSTGMVVLGIVWLAAFVGILVESIWLSRPRWLPIVWCAVMFAMGLIVAPELQMSLTGAGGWLLVAAVICFAAGLVLYVFRKVPYLWFVSHLVVLGGSVCLFLSVVLFVI